MTELAARFPALFRLFGGYLNQDWDEHRGTPEAAIDRFREEATPVEVGEAVAALRTLLRENREEKALRRALDSLSCGYDPGRGRVRAWLRGTAERLDAKRPA